MEIEDKYKNKMILLVDDVASMRNMTKAILRDIGFENIDDTWDGINALSLIKKGHYDLIICDWNMPKMDGAELLKILREDKAYKSLPFLMLTSTSDIDHVKKAIAEGVTDYITKPFQPNYLCKKILSALS